jgi:hypothetical protein
MRVEWAGATPALFVCITAGHRLVFLITLSCRLPLISRADCTKTPLIARRLWVTNSMREAASIPFPSRSASVETVGRQWLAAGRSVVWRLMDVTEGEYRVSGAVIRAESGERLKGFLRAVETRTRSCPKTSTTGRVFPITVADDGSIGG